MVKHSLRISIIVLIMLVAAACGSKQEQAASNSTAANNTTASSSASSSTSNEASTTTSDAANTTKTVKFLDREYTVPAKTDRIVITGSMESMEDALMLGVQPLGGITVGGKFPEMFAPISNMESVGEKMQPSVETILQLKPDVILGSSKFPKDVMEKLGKMAPTFPVSHISTNWEANLRLMAELTGKQEQAEQVLTKLKDDIAAAKVKLGDKFKDKKAVVVRFRKGHMFIYPETVYLNPTLYAELGLTVPVEVKAAKAQEKISLEKFSEMNPDYIFVQFEETENKDKPNALADVQNNPIWKSLNAVKNGKVFVNAVDPLAQGGTAWSKTKFLEAAVDKLTQP
ncbi:iron-hydroxamate ABC transporter substrate-binding protein [Paenibacillus sp. 481]|uniref:iron-hydroxamate ABC transporter substrate-binding protein n=1 Tax=Paenibacillus sp. 481 TaxID=2835869 RepID=UPI001E5E84B0|nr:iron-hydroxamate ABC transporter substrate-binding protein [Paenibacillus sp. 481]UHA74841.1 iron-hydroxamate ABC transporter substrate-binding protein [Paenibacillus sp. 481]